MNKRVIGEETGKEEVGKDDRERENIKKRETVRKNRGEDSNETDRRGDSDELSIKSLDTHKLYLSLSILNTACMSRASLISTVHVQ